MIHISRERRRFSGLAATTVCAAFLAAACSGPAVHDPTTNPLGGPVPAASPVQASRLASGPSPAGSGRSARPPASHSAPPATARRTSSPSPSPSPSASSSPTTPPGPPSLTSCATSGLRGALGAGTVAAGTFYYPVQLTNASATACTLFGYPGVSVVTGPQGAQIGAMAARIATFSPHLITLGPGATVHASLQMPDPGVVGPSACVPKTVQWLRVYPPGQFDPLYINVPATANPVQICTGSHLDGATPLGIFVVMTGPTGA
jgi:hypothetical protein